MKILEIQKILIVVNKISSITPVSHSLDEYDDEDGFEFQVNVSGTNHRFWFEREAEASIKYNEIVHWVRFHN